MCSGARRLCSVCDGWQILKRAREKPLIRLFCKRDRNLTPPSSSRMSPSPRIPRHESLYGMHGMQELACFEKNL